MARCVELTPESDPELWWATIGGMGLTGIVVEATFAALPIETSRCVVDTTRTADLDSLLAAMAEGDERYRYSVAWVDLLATGRHLGRSVLTRGDHATRRAGHRTSRSDRLRPADARRRAARRAQPDQPRQRQGVQRDVVPQGAATSPGRDPIDHPVLPPARRDRGVEPGVRPARLPPVPVRGAVRTRRPRSAA